MLSLSLIFIVWVVHMWLFVVFVWASVYALGVLSWLSWWLACRLGWGLRLLFRFHKSVGGLLLVTVSRCG